MEKPVVLVTGASRGIGLALCKELAARGCTVLAGARDPAGAHALQEAVHCATPGTIEILALDVRRDESVRAAVDEVSV